MMRAVLFVELAHIRPFIALLAIATHYILHNGEWDNSLDVFFGIWMVAFISLIAMVYGCDPKASTIGAAVWAATSIAALYFSVLTISILLHRGFFHRLRTIPGPFLARFSKLYGVFAGVLPDYQYYKKTEEWHEQYGSDVVRTGPREVNIYCADAIPVIHGPMSRCRKTLWYVGGNTIGGKSVLSERDKNEHKVRRKAWDHALSTKALREYEPRLNRHARALMSQLETQAKQPSVRITNWINFYSFDVMGDVGFNRSFGMVEKGEEDATIKLLHESMAPISIFTHLAWAIDLITKTASGVKPLHDHINWTRKVLQQRLKVKIQQTELLRRADETQTTPKEKDIISWLIDPNKVEISPDLNADARLLVVAGSDTVSTTLAWLTYELCKNPGIQTKLRKQLDAIAPSKYHLDVEDVMDCVFLDGVINEALRLHPAVPGGVQRETPPEGITLPNGTYIPGNIHIWMPLHTIQRDARYFADPLTFLPERWTDERAEAIINKHAFMPFNTGTYSCVGQKLAMLELRSVAANLIRSFVLSFADGEDGAEILKSRDCFTTNVGKLDVKLTPRREV